MAKAKTTQAPTPASYAAAEQELAELVQRLESGDLPLEELLAGYQRGTQLLAFCRERLAAVEHQVQELEAASDSASAARALKPE
jgi:exodeoxyribonuclease VII small subunit